METFEADAQNMLVQALARGQKCGRQGRTNSKAEEKLH